MSEQTATTSVSLKRADDGMPGNPAPVHRVMLKVEVLGCNKPFEHRIGTFEDGYESIAKEFCEWFNAKGHAMMKGPR